LQAKSKYVYVAWNMLSADNRMVGTGAYISKVSTYVTIPGHGTTAKHDLTEMWGVNVVVIFSNSILTFLIKKELS
jgi:hypothetical protein